VKVEESSCTKEDQNWLVVYDPVTLLGGFSSWEGFFSLFSPQVGFPYS